MVSGPGVGSGIRRAVSLGGAVAPDDAPDDLAGIVEKGWAGESGVGLVGEDRTCGRVGTMRFGEYTAYPIFWRFGRRALGADAYADIGGIQCIAD